MIEFDHRRLEFESKLRSVGEMGGTNFADHVLYKMKWGVHDQLKLERLNEKDLVSIEFYID